MFNFAFIAIFNFWKMNVNIFGFINTSHNKYAIFLMVQFASLTSQRTIWMERNAWNYYQPYYCQIELKLSNRSSCIFNLVLFTYPITLPFLKKLWVGNATLLGSIDFFSVSACPIFLQKSLLFNPVVAFCYFLLILTMYLGKNDDYS